MGRFKILRGARKAAKMIKRLQCTTYLKKLRELGLLSSKKGKLMLSETDSSHRNIVKGQQALGKSLRKIMTGYKENSLQ